MENVSIDVESGHFEVGKDRKCLDRVVIGTFWGGQGWKMSQSMWNRDILKWARMENVLIAVESGHFEVAEDGKSLNRVVIGTF